MNKHPQSEICLMFGDMRKKEVDLFIKDNFSDFSGEVIINEEIYAKYDSIIEFNLDFPVKAFQLQKDCSMQILK